MRISVLAVMAGALAGCATPAGQGLGRGAMPAAASSEEQASATSSWKWRCERGFAVDCRKLGRAHLHGTGVPRDDRLAAAYLVKACEIGEPASCGDLGVLTILGRGVAQDDAGGGALTRRACDAGHALACSNLGTLTVEGVNKLTLRPDQEGELGVKITRYFQTACDAGVPEGCFNLATAMERGQLALKDLPRAAATFQRACSGGLPVGCHRLALLARETPGAAPGVDLAALDRQASRAGIASSSAPDREPPGPVGPLTPSPRLMSDPYSYALGIPGSGGFHPSDLAARAAGQRGAHDRFERLPFEAWGSLPPALRGRLQLDAPAEAGALGDEAVELLVALRRSQLATCLERERSQPAATSLASVFMLEAGGRPVDLRTASEPADPGLEGCAREVILDWSFPVPADGRSGPHLVRIDYEAALPGPAPGYASSGGLRAALKEPGCVERRLRLAEGDRGAEKAVTVKLAVDADGRPALFHALTPAPEPVVLAIGAAVRACEFTPGVGDDGRPLPLWLTLTVKLDGR